VFNSELLPKDVISADHTFVCTLNCHIYKQWRCRYEYKRGCW